MFDTENYDVLIVGGGLAGLTNAIQLAQKGLKIALFEKNTYPFHRVCGEYISNETLPFLKSMGINPFDLGAVALTQFRLTSPKGTILDMPLDLGGFGISRFTLDNALYELAKNKGVVFFLNTQVSEIHPLGDKFKLITEQKGAFEAPIVIGSYGKRANLDNFFNRRFFRQRSPYIGVKYHIKTELQPEDSITLHNFKDGYCGISRVEDGKYCLCYLTTRKNLKKYQSIEQMEKQLLVKNPFLKQIWNESEFLFDKPKVINEISFASKPLIESGVLMCGDTGGMIAPLCGNGMAMAIHSAKILSELIITYFEEKISKEKLENDYQDKWKSLFLNRLWLGRNVQRFFGNPILTEILLLSGKYIKPFGKFLVKQSHGEVF